LLFVICYLLFVIRYSLFVICYPSTSGTLVLAEKVLWNGVRESELRIEVGK